MSIVTRHDRGLDRGAAGHRRSAGRAAARIARGLLVPLVLLSPAIYYGTRGCGPSRGTPRSPEFAQVNTNTEAFRARCGHLTPDRKPVVITMLYSDEKKPWVEHAANEFGRLCQNIQLKLIALSNIESAEAILSGKHKPTVWSPADGLVLRYFDHQWREAGKGSLFDVEQRRPLIRSPVVWLAWESRYQVVQAILESGSSPEGAWVQVPCAGVPRKAPPGLLARNEMVPGRWIDWYRAAGSPLPGAPPAGGPPRKRGTKPLRPLSFPSPEQIESWGRMKFAYTSPTTSGSGLEAVYMMAYEYVLTPSERGALIGDRDALNREIGREVEPLRSWLQRCQAGLEVFSSSTQLLTDSIFRLGPDRYDVVVTYEHLTFTLLTQRDEQAAAMEDLRVIYPDPTVWNEHPVVVLRHGDPQERVRVAAAEKWIAFLLDTEMQNRAIDMGFRPANPEIRIRDKNTGANPFMRLRRFGVEPDITEGELLRLDGKVVNDLIELWGDATGRN